jgi:hypothetical protein
MNSAVNMSLMRLSWISSVPPVEYLVNKLKYNTIGLFQILSQFMGGKLFLVVDRMRLCRRGHVPDSLAIKCLCLRTKIALNFFTE